MHEARFGSNPAEVTDEEAVQALIDEYDPHMNAEYTLQNGELQLWNTVDAFDVYDEDKEEQRIVEFLEELAPYIKEKLTIRNVITDGRNLPEVSQYTLEDGEVTRSSLPHA